MTLNYVALTITEQDAGEDAGTGSVLVAPTGAVVAAGVTVVSTVPVSRSLSSGAVTVNLVATDNSGTTPGAGFWAYQITLPGGQPQLYLIPYANGASQRLDNLTPVVAQTTYGPAAATSGVTSFNTRTGAVTPQSGDYSSFYDTSGAASTALTAAESFATSAVGTETTRAETAEGTLTTAVGGKVAKAGDTMTGYLAPKAVTLTDGSSVAIDASAGNVFDWPLGGSSHTLAAPSNAVDGDVIVLRIGYSGSFTPLFNAIFDFNGSAPTWTATSGKEDEAAFRYRAASTKWRYQGSMLGFTS